MAMDTVHFGYKRLTRISTGARVAMERAAQALTDAVPALLGEEALAERERLRREDSLKESPQRELDIGGKPWV